MAPTAPDPIVVDHPIVASRLAVLRDEATPRSEFRRALRDLAVLLVYEACRDLPATKTTVTTPLGPAPAQHIDQPPILVPVLRAGLGLLDGALELLPDAGVGFVGLSRDEATLLPYRYLDTVPDLDGRPALVLDPMLATGGSLIETVELVRQHGATRLTVVCVVAAPEGVAAFREAGHDDAIVTAALDDGLNEVGFIVPGLGDAGDRQFGVA